jgi:hypothetical protein
MVITGFLKMGFWAFFLKKKIFLASFFIYFGLILPYWQKKKAIFFGLFNVHSHNAQIHCVNV